MKLCWKVLVCSVSFQYKHGDEVLMKQYCLSLVLLQDYDIGREWRVFEFSICVFDSYDEVLISETVDHAS